jgi:hypothetical protein
MRFDRPDTSAAAQNPPISIEELTQLYSEYPTQPYVFQDMSFPKAELQKDSDQTEYLVFAAMGGVEDHSSGESQEQRKARILQNSPELQLDAMVSNRTREVIMDLLGINREKTPLETIMSWMPGSKESAGKEIKVINDAWRSMTEQERNSIASELRESAKNPDLATPAFNKFVNQDWSSALNGTARERRDNYLAIMSIENK